MIISLWYLLDYCLQNSNMQFFSLLSKIKIILCLLYKTQSLLTALSDSLLYTLQRILLIKQTIFLLAHGIDSKEKHTQFFNLFVFYTNEIKKYHTQMSPINKLASLTCPDGFDSTKSDLKFKAYWKMLFFKNVFSMSHMDSIHYD